MTVLPGPLWALGLIEELAQTETKPIEADLAVGHLGGQPLCFSSRTASSCHRPTRQKPEHDTAKPPPKLLTRLRRTQAPPPCGTNSHATPLNDDDVADELDPLLNGLVA